MAVVIAAALVLFATEFISLFQLRKEARELLSDELIYIEDAHKYSYIEEDYNGVDLEILDFDDELRYAI